MWPSRFDFKTQRCFIAWSFKGCKKFIATRIYGYLSVSKTPEGQTKRNIWTTKCCCSSLSSLKHNPSSAKLWAALVKKKKIISGHQMVHLHITVNFSRVQWTHDETHDKAIIWLPRSQKTHKCRCDHGTTNWWRLILGASGKNKHYLDDKVSDFTATMCYAQWSKQNKKKNR